MDEYTIQHSYLLTYAFHIKRGGAVLVQVNPAEAQKEESLVVGNTQQPVAGILPTKTERWTQMVACAHNLLVLARPLLQGSYRPWERCGSVPTLAQVRRAMPTLLQQLGTPARAPQRRGKAPGRAKGFHPKPRPRYPVIRKTSKKRKKGKRSAST